MVNNAREDGEERLPLAPSIPAQSKDETPYQGEDIYKPYNITAQQTGAINEWRDKKQEWDELV